MIYVLCGPGGAGKDTVLDKVVAKGLATRVVSYTTRPRRHGEVKGKAYHFVSREEFEAKLAAGDLSTESRAKVARPLADPERQLALEHPN